MPFLRNSIRIFILGVFRIETTLLGKMNNTLENWSSYRSYPNPLNDFTFTHDDPSSSQLNIDRRRSSADPNHDPNASFVDRGRNRSPADKAGDDDRDSSDDYDTDLDNDEKGRFLQSINHFTDPIHLNNYSSAEYS